MISCWWSSDVYFISVGRWTDNETDKFKKLVILIRSIFEGQQLQYFEFLIKIIYDSEVIVKLRNCCWF